MVRAKKHLGQHFLRSEATAARIAEALTGNGYRQVLEVGPGEGVLTQHLLRSRQMETWVAEIDRESVEHLERRFPDLQQRILPGDFLQMDLHRWFTEPFALVGNYPYNISSQIIFKMLDYRDLIPEMVGMFQKEVGERLVAEPGSRTYGILSVLTSAFYTREYLFTVEPEEFRPPPKVRSGVIRMQRREQGALGCDEADFRRVVKMAFNQRRKTLRNALKGLNLPPDAGDDKLLSLRAEQLHYRDFVYLAQKLSS